MKKWLRRGLLALLGLPVVVVGAGIGYEQWARRSVAEEFPPPGQLVEHGGQRSHLNCTGQGSPTVVLEAGLGVAGSLSWRAVQRKVAAGTRVCSYDRAGYLWSEPRDEPRDANRIARELHALLQASSESPPYLLVGHSLGGLLIRVYDDRYTGEVTGFVFVDPSHPEQFDRYPPGVVEYRTRRTAALPPPLLFRAWVFVGGYRLTLAPPDNAVQAYLWRTVPWGFLGEENAREAIYEQASSTGPLGDRPVVVLTAGEPTSVSGLSDAVLSEWHETHRVLHAEIADLSTNSDLRRVEGAGHNIHRDDPEAVVAAIRDVVQAARRDTAVTDSTRFGS